MRNARTENKERNARLKALDERCGFDYIIEEYEAKDYTQFVVSMGGDALTFRVYGHDGEYKVYAR